MHSHLEVLRKYFVFSGRASRREYWLFTVFYLLTIMLAVIVDFALGTFDAQLGFGRLSWAYFVLTLPPVLGLSVRRLHDIGRSGWWVLIGAIPGVGDLILLVLALFDSQPGDNTYGPNPKTQHVGSGAVKELPAVLRAPNRFRRAVKVALVCAAVVVVVAGAGRTWWSLHGDDFLAAGKAAMDEGRSAGQSLDERACLVDAVERTAAKSDMSLGESVANGLRLSGCLETSHLQASFCDEVPTKSELLASASWSASSCSQRGLSNALCTTLLQNVVTYCSSPVRASKSGEGQKAAATKRGKPACDFIAIETGAMKHTATNV